MATSPIKPPAVLPVSPNSSVILLQRLEGLAAVAISAALYARSGANWWLFAALWIMPDLSILAYLAGPRWGARVYNTIHAYVLPAALASTALALGSDATMPYALIWFNHIGADRFLGYGLKYADGFGVTHLGLLGKRRMGRMSMQREVASAKSL